MKKQELVKYYMSSRNGKDYSKHCVLMFLHDQMGDLDPFEMDIDDPTNLNGKVPAIIVGENWLGFNFKIKDLIEHLSPKHL